MKPHRSWFSVLAATVSVALAASVVACAAAPPPPPAPKPVSTREAPKAEPPPTPPKCESLEEDCRADDKTEARIAGCGHVFRPPEGWVYAQLPGATMAQKNGTGPVMVLVTFESPSGAVALRKQQEAKADELAKLVQVEPSKPKIQLLTPGSTEDYGGLKMTLWDHAKGKRGDAPGPILVFAADIGSGRRLFGMGFVPEADDTKADVAILDALKSIRAKPSEEGDPPSGGADAEKAEKGK